METSPTEKNIETCKQRQKQIDDILENKKSNSRQSKNQSKSPTSNLKSPSPQVQSFGPTQRNSIYVPKNSDEFKSTPTLQIQIENSEEGQQSLGLKEQIMSEIAVAEDPPDFAKTVKKRQLFTSTSSNPLKSRLSRYAQDEKEESVLSRQPNAQLQLPTKEDELDGELSTPVSMTPELRYSQRKAQLMNLAKDLEMQMKNSLEEISQQPIEESMIAETELNRFSHIIGNKSLIKANQPKTPEIRAGLALQS